VVHSGKKYHDLVAWQKAMDLVESVYRLTDALPEVEIYGLTSLLRRAAASVPSNITGGEEHSSPNDSKRFLYTAQGFIREIETQVEITVRLKYLTPESATATLSLCENTGRKISGLANSLKVECG